MARGDKELPIQEFPDVYQYVSICLTDANFVDQVCPIFYAEEDTVVDSVTFTSNIAEGDVLTLELAACDAGQAFGSGDQFTTDVTALTALTPAVATIDRTKNVLTAGQFIQLNFADNGTNAIDCLNVTLRIRTRVR